MLTADQLLAAATTLSAILHAQVASFFDCQRVQHIVAIADLIAKHCIPRMLLIDVTIFVDLLLSSDRAVVTVLNTSGGGSPAQHVVL